MGKKKGGSKRQPDVIDVRDPPPGVVPPTPEQAGKAEYVVTDFNERVGGVSLKLGHGYRRMIRFEGIEGLTTDHLVALRRYREAFDQSERSPVKSGLDIGVGGGMGGAEAAIARIQDVAFADIELRRIEAAVPAHLLQTLRGVALLDQDFKALAMERYGSRTVERIDSSGRKPAIVRTLEPRSGRHREAIRRQFIEAADQLVAARVPARPLPIAPIAASSGDEPLASVDPRFLDEQGRMREWNEIADILRAGSGDDQDLRGGTEWGTDAIT